MRKRHYAWIVPLVLLTLLVAALGIAVSTQAGLDALLAAARSVLPGLSYERIEGRLLGPLAVEELRYEDGETRIRVAHAAFDWAPSELLGLTLRIHRLHVAGVTAQLPPTAEEPPPPEPETPFTLPELRLPIEIVIEDVALTDIRVQPAGAPRPVVLERLALVAGLRAEGLEVETLDVALEEPPVGASLTGSLRPVGAWPMDLLLRWTYTDPLLGELRGEGQVSGDLDALRLTHGVTGGATADVEAEVSDVLSVPRWDARVVLEALPLEPFGPQFDGARLGGQIESRGSLEDFTASGELATELGLTGPARVRFEAHGNTRQVRLDTLVVQAGTAPLTLEADATVDLETLRVDANGRWKSLAWPLVGEPQVRSPEGRFQVRGTPTDYGAELDAALAGREFGDLEARIRASGTDERVDLTELSLSAPGKSLSLEVQGGLQLADLAFEATGRWQSLAWPLVGEPQVQSPEGRFEARGTPTDYTARLDAGLASRDFGEVDARLRASGTDERVDLTELSLKAPDGPLSLAVQGHVRLTDLAFEATGRWQSLAWPLVGEPQVQSPEGRFEARGDLEDYRFLLETEARGPAIPVSRWHLEGSGSAEALESAILEGKLLDGEIRVVAAARWQPAVSWEAAVSASSINPGAHWPGWPGKLGLEASSEGRLDEAGLQARVALKRLDGKLREQSVDSEALVRIQGEAVDIDQLNLEVGATRLRASGSLAQRWDIQWALESPDLGRLAPGARGSVSGSGTLSGPREAPRARLKLTGAGTGYGQDTMERLQVEADVDLTGAQRSSLDLAVTGIEVAGQSWNRLDLEGGGTPGDHRLSLALEGGPADLALGLQGGLQTDATWRGRITRLDASGEAFGSWSLESPLALQAGARQASAERACLSSPPARLCLQGQWDVDQGAQGRLSLDRLALARFEQFLPPGLEIDTELSLEATGQAAPGAVPRGAVDLRLSPGGLRMTTTAEPVDITLAGASVRAELTARGLDARLNLDLDRLGGVQSQIQVRDPAGAGRLGGTLEAEIVDLGLITAFAPQLAAVEGRITADLGLGGTLATPAVTGEARLADFAVEVPGMGLRVSEVQFAAVSDGSGALALSGSARSGPGRLDLSGRVQPRSGEVELSVQGERFQVANSSEIQVLVEPDLELRVAGGEVRLEGRVRVPRALLSPPDISSGVSPSADVVYVGREEEETGPPLQVYARLRVILGEDVRVEASGFKGRLEGNLLVEQTPTLAPRASGSIEVVEGQFKAYGQDLTIEQGRIFFGGGPVDNPGLDLQAVRTVRDVKAGARILGTARRPELELYSEPPLPDATILSYILFGRPPDARSPGEGEMLFKAATALGMSGGNALSGQLTESLGLDTLQFESGEEGASSAALVIGKYLAPDLYVSYGIGLFEPINTFSARYDITERVSFESSSTGASSSADVIYTIER